MLSLPRLRSPHRSLSLLVLGTLGLAVPLAAEEAASDEGPTPTFTAALPDLTATAERYAASPYAALAETEWAQYLLAELRTGITQENPQLLDLVASVTRAEFAFDFDLAALEADEAPPLAVSLHTPEAFQFAQMLMDLDPEAFVIGADEDSHWRSEDGRVISVVEGAMRFSLQDGEALLPVTVPDRAGDLHFHLDYGHLMAQLLENPEFQAEFATSGLPIEEIFAGLDEAEISFAAEIDGNGIRERAVMSGFEDWSWAAFAPDLAIDRELFATLPADTLWAFVSVADREAMQAWIESPAGQVLFAEGEGMEMIDGMLMQFGLPPYRELLTALDGDILLYARASAPFPAFTLQIGIDETVGGQILDLLAGQLGLVDDGDGIYRGRVQVVPVAAMVAEGQLVITTHPLGIDGHSQRKPGFTEHPAVVAALAELPAGRLQAAGLSRSAEWWGTLASLAAIPLSQSEIPGVLNLGNDLRDTGSHGWMWMREPEAGTYEYEGGGLLGGAGVQYVGVVGFAMGSTFYMMRGMQREFEQIEARPMPRAAP